MTSFTESVVEDAALVWLESLSYTILHGPDIAIGESAAEHSDPNYRDWVLEGRQHQALMCLKLALSARGATLADPFEQAVRLTAAEKGRA